MKRQHLKVLTRGGGTKGGWWGLDFKEDPCQGPEDILVFENMTDRLIGGGGGQLERGER